ncbi:MAG TPA: efflux RND transporter periplasmic adaptor subunit [Candidatus Acidoferrum sp.]|jgi:RND family efflux transporter MFP subunit
MTKTKLLIVLFLAVGVALLAWHWMARTATEADDRNHSAVPTAAVAIVKRRDLGDTLSVSGAFKPFQDIDVHAKVAGYIKVIYVDVGSHVTVGQTLAILEVPELAAELAGTEAAVHAAQEQIRRAQGDLDRAQSTYSAAHSAYTRLKQAADTQPGLVAQQEVDDSQAKDLGTQAQVASAEAELSGAKQQLEEAEDKKKQYTALSDYTHITAPFAGVVTVRYADTGSLIAAGTSTSTQSMPVVRLAQVSVLRLVLQIPESVAPQIHVGGSIRVHVQALDHDYEGKVARFADSLDQQTRTMETEIDFQNSDGKLIPGMFCEAYFVHNKKANVLTVPVEAISRTTEGAKVFVVDLQGAVELRSVNLGQEGSTRIEVVSGLTEGERVIVGNLSEFAPGQKVSPKIVDAGTASEAGTN